SPMRAYARVPAQAERRGAPPPSYRRHGVGPVSPRLPEHRTGGYRQRGWGGQGAPLALLDLGAGERIRTADLPFTRRLLCQLSYTGGRLGAWLPTRGLTCASRL